MYWKSMSDFLHMGGYGLYVWISFGITFACIAVELFLLRSRRLNNEKIKDLL
jgi:heme exporter protein D